MLETDKHLVIFDGYSFVFRAYHSLPPFTDPSGTPVGAVYGFTSMLMKTLEDLKATHAAVVFDSGQKNFRHDIYPEYKANRPPAPDDLIPQFPLVRTAAKAFNLRIYEQEGLEADDIIAYFAKLANSEQIQLTIVSSDKDLMQLIGPYVRMYDSMKNKMIGSKQVEEKFGVPPKKVLDLLSLTGDSSDNIPGVPSIGPKTAAQLLTDFGDLDGIYSSLENIKQAKRKAVLQDNKEKAYLSKKLITLKSDIDISVSLEDIKYLGPKKSDLYQFLNIHKFKSLLANFEKKFGKQEAEKEKIVSYHFENITKSNLANLSALIELHGKCAVNLDNQNLQITVADQNFTYSCTQQRGELNFDNQSQNDLSMREIASFFKELFERDDILVLAYSVKEILHFLKDHVTIETVNNYHDVMIISYLLNAGLNKHSKDALLAEFFPEQSSFNSCHIFEIYQVLLQELHTNKLMTLYERVERRLPGLLFKMESTGVAIDTQLLTSLSTEFAGEMEVLAAQIYKEAGKDFNIGSPKQLGEILFVDLGIAGGKKGKSGAYVTDSETLENLASSGYVIAEKVLHWRQLSKLKSTYTDALVKLKNPLTGRLHSTFALTNTTTGRLSSSNPNLQNIPTRTDIGKKIREAFIAAPGYKLLAADYSQIELRLLAHIANVKPLIKAFNEELDIHAVTAAEMFHLKLEDVDAELRRKAKTINFGIIYGVSAFGLARRIGISRTEAAEYIEQYFQKYPGIKDYMHNIIEEARGKGYVTSLMGRKVFVKDINSKNAALRHFSERAAINGPLQATSADIIKKAMLELDESLNNFPKSRLILQVHDELLLETTESEENLLASTLKKIMENQLHISVPLTVNTTLTHSYK